MYLPIDFKNKCNVGWPWLVSGSSPDIPKPSSSSLARYGFINFRTQDSCERLGVPAAPGTCVPTKNTQIDPTYTRPQDAWVKLHSRLCCPGRFIGLFHGVDVRKCLPGLNSKKVVEAGEPLLFHIPQAPSKRDRQTISHKALNRGIWGVPGRSSLQACLKRPMQR